jgi:flagellar hook assembly protein FlgD
LALYGGVPNPFNPSTRLAFDLPSLQDGTQGVRVRLDIIDLRGRLVRQVLQASLEAGRHGVIWDGRDDGGRDVPSGVYLARLRAADHIVSRKLILLR